MTILSILLFLSASVVAIMYQKNKNFKRFLKVGDYVKYYIGNESERAKVISINNEDNTVKIKIVGEYEIITVNRDEIYASLLEHYKP